MRNIERVWVDSAFPPNPRFKFRKINKQIQRSEATLSFQINRGLPYTPDVIGTVHAKRPFSTNQRLRRALASRSPWNRPSLTSWLASLIEVCLSVRPMCVVNFGVLFVRTYWLHLKNPRITCWTSRRVTCTIKFCVRRVIFVPASAKTLAHRTQWQLLRY